MVGVLSRSASSKEALGDELEAPRDLSEFLVAHARERGLDVTDWVGRHSIGGAKYGRIRPAMQVDAVQAVRALLTRLD